jgi:polyferredoxin
MLSIVVIAASYFVSTVWVQKKEVLPEKQALLYEGSMTIKAFGEANGLSNNVLEKVFKIGKEHGPQTKISTYNLSVDKLTDKVDKARVIEAEHGSKNWKKIFIKFILWFAVLGLSFYLIRRGKITPGVRKSLYLASLTIFGIILGSDPSAMGTVKDAIKLFAEKGVIFPPRMIAFSVFVLLVLIANKFFCSWGCQLGTLQDLIFRINRDKKDSKSVFRQYKTPFIVTNIIRFVFLAIFTIAAFTWAIDIVEYIDPFKVFKPSVISIFGWGFLAVILIFSLFIYRPWCSLFCPFGAVGWFVEKLSIFKIKVNYETCKACESCAKRCPSTAMESILKREKTITDCFSCGSCIEECPTGSITFSSGKRLLPPAGKFVK